MASCKRISSLSLQPILLRIGTFCETPPNAQFEPLDLLFLSHSLRNEDTGLDARISEANCNRFVCATINLKWHYAWNALGLTGSLYSTCSSACRGPAARATTLHCCACSATHASVAACIRPSFRMTCMTVVALPVTLVSVASPPLLAAVLCSRSLCGKEPNNSVSQTRPHLREYMRESVA
jgi:hypothetical protein